MNVVLVCQVSLLCVSKLDKGPQRGLGGCSGQNTVWRLPFSFLIKDSSPSTPLALALLWVKFTLNKRSCMNEYIPAREASQDFELEILEKC